MKREARGKLRNAMERSRSLLAKDVGDEQARQVIEKLLRYMEQSSADRAEPDPRRQHGGPDISCKADSELLDIVARELIAGRGLRTVSYLRELSEIANEAGDRLSADAWQHLVDAAERIIQISYKGDRKKT